MNRFVKRVARLLTLSRLTKLSIEINALRDFSKASLRKRFATASTSSRRFRREACGF